MQEDAEGFLYPEVNHQICISCGLCKKICPVINQTATNNKPINVYAAKSQNEEVRLNSSSGGVFYLLAEKIIQKDGVVFGACFNEKWEIIHDYTETIKGLNAFRGSKYVQSRIGKTFIQAKQFLKEGRYVLFSGTPCQIMGLKFFLRKEYDNLLTVDVVCHGVPSPKVWRMYLSQLTDNQKITEVNFRDKRNRWRFVIEHPGKNLIVEPLYKNVFTKGFLKDLYLRPSCYACPSKSFKSGSDITLGDYWGIQNVLPDFDDDKGVSLVMVNTQKGQSFFNDIDVIKQETSYSAALKGNPIIEVSVKIPKKRSIFFDQWNEENLIPLIEKLSYQSFIMKILFKIARLKRKLKFIYE
jgi:coenzyme F420-reducing hydrogenase beta subunit